MIMVREKAADPLIPNAIVLEKQVLQKILMGKIMLGLLVGWNILGGYSIVVLLENSGSGGAVAAPVAKNIFEKIILFSKT